MSLQTIRSLFERKLTAAFSGLSPSVPVIYDNVKKAPSGAAKEYVSLILSFPSLTEPIISNTESSIEVIRGIIQVNCYGPKSELNEDLNELSRNKSPSELHPKINKLKEKVESVLRDNKKYKKKLAFNHEKWSKYT